MMMAFPCPQNATAALTSRFDTRLDERFADERDSIVEIVNRSAGRNGPSARAGEALSDEVRKLRLNFANYRPW